MLRNLALVCNRTVYYIIDAVYYPILNPSNLYENHTVFLFPFMEISNMQTYGRCSFGTKGTGRKASLGACQKCTILSPTQAY